LPVTRNECGPVQVAAARGHLPGQKMNAPDNSGAFRFEKFGLGLVV